MGSSPLDRLGASKPGPRDGTPDVGSKKPSSTGKPDSDRSSPDTESQNMPGGDPASRATARTSSGQAIDRWGDLPVHVREVFRNNGRSDLPPEYHDWIDAYYRRLNELK